MGQESKNRDCPDEIGTVGNYDSGSCQKVLAYLSMHWLAVNAVITKGKEPEKCVPMCTSSVRVQIHILFLCPSSLPYHVLP